LNIFRICVRPTYLPWFSAKKIEKFEAAALIPTRLETISSIIQYHSTQSELRELLGDVPMLHAGPRDPLRLRNIAINLGVQNRPVDTLAGHAKVDCLSLANRLRSRSGLTGVHDSHTIRNVATRDWLHLPRATAAFRLPLARRNQVPFPRSVLENDTKMPLRVWYAVPAEPMLCIVAQARCDQVDMGPRAIGVTQVRHCFDFFD